MTTDVLTVRALNRATLARQFLLQRTTASLTDLVEHLVGLQAQAPLAPYYGLWSRLEGFRASDLERSLIDRLRRRHLEAHPLAGRRPKGAENLCALVILGGSQVHRNFFNRGKRSRPGVLSAVSAGQRHAHALRFAAVVPHRAGPTVASRDRRQRVAAGALVAGLVVAFWAADLLGRDGAHRQGRSPTLPAVQPVPVAAWADHLSGTLNQLGPSASGLITVTIESRVWGAQTGALEIVLLGREAGGIFRLRSSAVDLDLGGRRWSGQLAALAGDQMAAIVRDADQHRITLAIDLQVDPATAAVTGALATTVTGPAAATVRPEAGPP